MLFFIERPIKKILKKIILFLHSPTYSIYCYTKTFGHKPDLKNPKTFYEKILWRKLYDNNPIYTLCSDKILVRDYIQEKIGEEYLIPVLQITDDAENIDFDILPESFVIKANHGSGWNLLVKNKNELDKKDTIKTCNHWLSQNYYYVHGEAQYKNIKPLLIIEKFLVDENNEIPKDYKFHCFDGNIEFIQLHTERFTEHKVDFYDEKWNKLNIMLGNYKNSNVVMPQPNNFENLKKIAKKLSKDFNYVRVDLYTINNAIYFGELTFTPCNGLNEFIPNKYGRYLGDKFRHI